MNMKMESISRLMRAVQRSFREGKKNKANGLHIERCGTERKRLSGSHRHTDRKVSTSPHPQHPHLAQIDQHGEVAEGTQVGLGQPEVLPEQHLRGSKHVLLWREI